MRSEILSGHPRVGIVHQPLSVERDDTRTGPQEASGEPSPSPSPVRTRLGGEALAEARRQEFENRVAADVRLEFSDRLVALASEGDSFHRLLRTVYGGAYDHRLAEALRQRTLSGDMSWLPPVEWVDDAGMSGGLGAYDQAGGLIYLNKNLLSDPRLAAAVYAEEVGHAVDGRLNATDSAGDEGELFRRMLYGERLTASDVAAIRAEDDRGSIVVDGRTIEVEFFLKEIARFVTRPLSRGVDAVFKRIGENARVIFQSSIGTAVGVLRGLMEEARQIGSGLAELLSGRLRTGLKEIGRRLVQRVIKTPINELILGVGSVVSAIQSLVGLEGKGERLNPEEVARLRPIFGDSIDYSAVLVKRGYAGVFSVNDRPFVLGNTVYMKDVNDPAVLAHELVHVWQYQNGGSDYLSEALISQKWGKGYNWSQSVPQTPWAELEPEQQAELIEQAVRYGYFDPAHPSYGRFVWRNQIDYTEYLEKVHRELRAGRGAP